MAPLLRLPKGANGGTEITGLSFHPATEQHYSLIAGRRKYWGTNLDQAASPRLIAMWQSV